MVRRLAVFILALTLLGGASCKKAGPDPVDEPDSGDYYIRFKVNGETHAYAGTGLVYAFSMRLSPTGAHQLLIQGRLQDDQNRNAVFFAVTDAAAVQRGREYRLADWLEWPEQNQSVSSVFGSYYGADGKQYFAQLRQLPSLPFEVKDAATVRFTEISEGSLKGTFTMKAYSTYPERAEAAITEGEFYVPIMASSL